MPLAIVACAVVGKLGACGVAARLGGFSWREAFCVGALMNTRELMELVIITIGRDLGMIPDSVFCMLVLMALATTFMTTPLVVHARHGSELEPFIESSGFCDGEAKRLRWTTNNNILQTTAGRCKMMPDFL